MLTESVGPCGCSRSGSPALSHDLAGRGGSRRCHNPCPATCARIAVALLHQLIVRLHIMCFTCCQYDTPTGRPAALQLRWTLVVNPPGERPVHRRYRPTSATGHPIRQNFTPAAELPPDRQPHHRIDDAQVRYRSRLSTPGQTKSDDSQRRRVNPTRPVARPAGRLPQDPPLRLLANARHTARLATVRTLLDVPAPDVNVSPSEYRTRCAKLTGGSLDTYPCCGGPMIEITILARAGRTSSPIWCDSSRSIGRHIHTAGLFAVETVATKDDLTSPPKSSACFTTESHRTLKSSCRSPCSGTATAISAIILRLSKDRADVGRLHREPTNRAQHP